MFRIGVIESSNRGLTMAANISWYVSASDRPSPKPPDMKNECAEVRFESPSLPDGALVLKSPNHPTRQGLETGGK